MVTSTTSVLTQRTATLRRLAEQTTGKNANNTAEIALYDERVQQNLDALQKVGRSRIDTVKERKAIAKQRLEELKARLRLLRMMPCSPRSMARQAAALAKEIAALARAYAGAGSGGTGGFIEGDTAATTAESSSIVAPSAESKDAPDSGSTDHAASTGSTPSHVAATDHEDDRAFFRDAQNMLHQLRKLIVRGAQQERQRQRSAGEIDRAEHVIAKAEREVSGFLSQPISTAAHLTLFA
jgi:hypothetical protein